MKYDEEFNYSYISKYDFDKKYLESKHDGSKYKKYILVYYEESNKIKSMEIYNELDLNKLKNIIKKYQVEEIISNCINFDSMYENLTYIHIKDYYFIKYQVSEEIEKLQNISNDNEEIKKILKNLE